MNPLDSNIKNKLEQNQLPYTDLQWQKMDALIQNQKQKKKFAFWWFNISSILILGLTSYALTQFINPGAMPTKLAVAVNSTKNKSNYNKVVNTTNKAIDTKIHSIKVNKKDNDANQSNLAVYNNYSKPASLHSKMDLYKKPTKLNKYYLFPTMESKNNTHLVVKLNANSKTTLEQFTSETIVNNKVLADLKIKDEQKLNLTGLAFKVKSLNWPMVQLEQVPSFSAPLLRLKENRNQKINWSIDANYAFPMYLKINNNLQSINAQSEVNATINKLTIGINAKKNNFIFSSGLELENYSHRQNYKQTISNYTFDTFYSLSNVNFIQRPNGKYVALIKRQIDTFSSSSEQAVCANCKTKVSYLNLPITIGYQFAFQKHWNWEIIGGLVYSKRISASGFGLKNNEVVSAKNSFSKSSQQWLLATNLVYDFGSNWYVKSGIQLSSGASSRAITYNFRQQVYWASFGLGFKFK